MLLYTSLDHYNFAHALTPSPAGSVGGVSGRRWWEVFSPESSESDLQDVARQIMTLYDSPAESSGQAEQLTDSHAQPREERGREGTVSDKTSVSGKQ